MQGISEGTPLAKPARLAPLSKNPASKASVEHFFRVPPDPLLALLALGAGVKLAGFPGAMQRYRRWGCIMWGPCKGGQPGPRCPASAEDRCPRCFSASLLARIRAPSSHAHLRLLQEKKIKELLQDLTSDLAVNQPDDPSRYLYDKIGSFFGAASALSQSSSGSV